MISDIRAMVPARKGLIGAMICIFKVFTYPRIWAVLLHRMAHFCQKIRLIPIAYILHTIQQVTSGAEIHPAAEVGPGWCLYHSQGLVMGDKVRVGQAFRCFQGVTIGDDGRRAGQPVIGNRVTIFAGAKVLGPVVLGDDAIVGANAVVLCDVPAGHVAVGIPAKVTVGKHL